MSDILLTAAQSFNKLSHINYEFTLSKNQKIIITSMSADNGDFAHIIGLDHLNDIWQFASHNTKIKGQIFRDILDGKYTFQDLSEATCHLYDIIPKTYNSDTNNGYSVAERISKICRIDQLLDNAYNGTIYKWDKDKCKVKTQDGKERKITINADYLLVIPSSSNEMENIYVFAYQVNKGKNEPIKLSILSAFADCIDLTKGQERPYTILQETKENIRTKEKEVLYTHPYYETNKSGR